MAGNLQSISHTGKVIGVTPEEITVEIISESACASCHAASLCGVAGGKVKLIELPASPYTVYEPGEEVEVLLKASMGHKAVWLAYVLPLVILIVTLMAGLGLGLGDLAAGLCCIAAVALYYLVIWLLRGRLRDSYAFAIRKKQSNNNYNL